MQLYTDTSAQFRIFDRVGKDIDIDLIQAELVCIQILLLHRVGVEAEFYILFLDHRL